MPDDDSGCPELWDEYQWERFLQQQDRKTEQYFQLFEKYERHPDRDEIIAREMGWSGEEEEWEDSEDEEEEEDSDSDVEDEDAIDELQNSEIYMQTMELNRRVFMLVEEREALKDHPVAVELATRSAICGAKLAAALCGDDLSEVGMTIAYLKRSLKAANDSLGALARLRQLDLIDDEDVGTIRELLFPIRESIVDSMGELREELRRRRGEI